MKNLPESTCSTEQCQLDEDEQMTHLGIKLALVVTDAYALSVLGRGQLEYFKTKGVDLSLYCGGSREAFQDLSSHDLGKITWVPFRRRPHPFWDAVAFLYLLGLFSLRRYDSIVCSTPKAMLIGSVVGALTRQKRRIALVRGRAYENASGIRRKAFVLLDRLAFACSHRVLFISHSLKQAYCLDGLPTRVQDGVLGHGSSRGVDLGRFRPVPKEKKSQLRVRLGLPRSKFIVLMVGRLTRDKGIYEALELAERLSDRQDVFWCFIGMVEDRAALRRLNALNPEAVRHFPHTDTIEDWFAAADLHLTLSKREGFGNVSIEAAACAVPTFGFKVVGVSDAVAPGITGQLFEPDDLSAVEAAIRDAASDPDAFARRFPDARRWVAERYEIKMLCRTYLDAFLGSASAEEQSRPAIAPARSKQ